MSWPHPSLHPAQARGLRLAAPWSKIRVGEALEKAHRTGGFGRLQYVATRRFATETVTFTINDRGPWRYCGFREKNGFFEVSASPGGRWPGGWEGGHSECRSGSHHRRRRGAGDVAGQQERTREAGPLWSLCRMGQQRKCRNLFRVGRNGSIRTFHPSRLQARGEPVNGRRRSR